MTMSASIFKNMIAQFFGRLYTSAVSFVINMVILARVLTESDFGVLNYYLTFYYIFITLIDFGTNTIAIREVSKNPDRLKGMLSALVKIRIITSVLCFIGVSLSAWLIEEESEFYLMIVLASSHLLFYCLGGYNAVFHIRMRFDYVALISCLGHSVYLGCGLLLWGVGSKNPAYFLMAYGLGMAVTNWANYILSRSFVKDSSQTGDVSELKALFREALPLGVSSVMTTIYFYVDTLLLRPLQGEDAVAYYNAAYRLLCFAIMAPILFNQVIFPLISKTLSKGEGNRERLKRIFGRAKLYMGATGLPVAVGMCFFAEPLIILVCGEKYAKSSGCLTILSLAMVCIFLTYPHISLLIASGRQILFAWIAGASGLLNVLLNLYLIPKYSFEGAAWATVISELFVLICAVVCVKRFIKIRFWHWELIKILILAGGVALACLGLRDLNLILAIGVLGALYFSLLYGLKLLPFDIGDDV